MQTSKRRVKLKAGGIALCAAVVAAAFAFPAARRIASPPPKIDEFLNPTRWKFDTARGAIAHVSGPASGTSETSLSAKRGTSTAYTLDAREGLTVMIEQPGPSPDCVYLRNGVALDGIHDRDDLVFRFSARGKTPKSKVCLILRERDEVRQSEVVALGPNWKDYSIPVNFHKFVSFQGIVAIQMGYQADTIELRGLQLESAK